MSRQMCPEKSEPTPCDCPVGSCTLREFRQLREPGGRERAMLEYRQKLIARTAERERGLDPRELSYRLQKIGVPAEDVIALRGDLLETAAMGGARRFLAAPAEAGMRFLLLLGGTGVGKTLAASYVVRDEARRFDWNGQASGPVSDPIQFVRAGDLTRVDFQDRVEGAQHRATLEAMVRCRLLVVDDAGDEGGIEGRRALAESLLKRDAAGRRTVITTNLTKERFIELYGQPLADRIRARGVVPNLAGERSRRKRAL
jgi:hypothetical protein